jgi:hypothetical protein
MTRMIEVKVAELSGRALDYAVALVEGWQLARNASGRSGDSFARYRDSNAKPRWPIGALCVVSPSSGKDLHAETVNWDGWLLPRGDEPLAPAAFDAMPRYSTDWSQGGPLIDKYKPWLSPPVGDPEDGDLYGWDAEIYGDDGELIADQDGCQTALVAACRAVVQAHLGDTVSVPAELVGGV